MKNDIADIIEKLAELSHLEFIVNLRIIEKTRSILKARVYFSEELFVQIYVNTRKPKRSYALILNDRRIYGRDYVFGEWHLHPFESPDEHYESEAAKESVTIEEFIEEAFYISSEKLEII